MKPRPITFPVTPPHEQARRSSWAKWLKWGIVALVTLFIGRAIRDGWDDFQKAGFTWRNIQPMWLLLAAIAYSLGMLPMAWNWHRLLNAMGQRVSGGTVIQAHYVSQLGKYVPGKAVVVAIRMGLLRPYGVDLATGILSMVSETLAMMSVGAFLAGLVIAIEYRSRPEMALLAMGMACLAGLPIIPPIQRWLLRWLRIRRWAHSEMPASQGETKLNWSNLAPGWLGIAGGWFLLGTSMWAVLRSLDLDTTRHLSMTEIPRVTAINAISVVAGFLSMLPGGFGVREWITQELMKSTYGTVGAMLTPLLYRLVSLVSEVTVFALISSSLGKERTISAVTTIPAEKAR